MFASTASMAAFSFAPVSLTLSQALNRLKNGGRNYINVDRNFRLAEISYDNAWDTMYMPTISLEGGVTSAKGIGGLSGTAEDSLGSSIYNRGYPTSNIGIKIAEYTLFNSWRDDLAFQQAKLTWDRAKESVVENQRALRFQLIKDYFKLWTFQEKLDAAKRSLTISSAILELVNSQVRIGKATENEVSSATVDKLAAATKVNEIQTEYANTQRLLALSLGDPIETTYVLTTPLKYVPVNVTEKQALESAEKLNPGIREARKGLRDAQISLEIAQKNRLPLPKVTLSGIQVGYTNNYYGNKEARSTTASNGTIEVVAALTLSVPLYGPGGLFNRRNFEITQINLDKTETDFIQAQSQLKSEVYSKIFTIKQTEQSIANQKQAAEQSEKVLNQLFSNLSKGQASRLELRDAINTTRNAQIEVFTAILSHLDAKIDLATFMGDGGIVGTLE